MNSPLRLSLFVLLPFSCLASVSCTPSSSHSDSSNLSVEAPSVPPLPTHHDPLVLHTLNIGLESIHAEIADTPPTRAHGLMNRSHLATNHGMLFVFAHPSTVSMWMKNTSIPLDVAFIDYRGTILNIESMSPYTLTHHSSRGPVVYALEMNAGWFRTHRIIPGVSVKNLPSYEKASF
jgi:uncharacterized protein